MVGLAWTWQGNRVRHTQRVVGGRYSGPRLWEGQLHDRTRFADMNGIDAMISIRDEFPEARIIVLTTYAGDVQVFRALKAGAQAYVMKNLVHRELLQTIRAVYAGRKTMSPEVAAPVAEFAAYEAL